jgi:hypothetical protein
MNDPDAASIMIKSSVAGVAAMIVGGVAASI